MTGCRHGAKNTLNENYLYLAEKAGAEIHPMTTVVDLREDGEGGHLVGVVPTDARRGRGTRRRDGAGPAQRTIRARWVVVAAGTYGTQTLLHRMRDSGRAAAPLAAAGRPDPHQLRGPGGRADRPAALPPEVRQGREARLHPRRRHHLLHPPRRQHPHRAGPLRQGLQRDGRADHAPGQPRLPAAARRWRYAVNCAQHPVQFVRSLSNYKWSERIIIGLVMQSLDNSLTTYRKEKGLGKGLLTARQGHGAPNPLHIPEGAEAARLTWRTRSAASPARNVGELMGTPLTAHFLGGCPIGADAEQRRHRPLPPAVRAPGHLRRRRRGRLGEPGRQPVADDHRAGGAGDGAVAQQGRGGPASGAGRRPTRRSPPVRAGRPGRPGGRLRRAAPPGAAGPAKSRGEDRHWTGRTLHPRSGRSWASPRPAAGRPCRRQRVVTGLLSPAVRSPHRCEVPRRGRLRAAAERAGVSSHPVAMSGSTKPGPSGHAPYG